MKSIRWLFFLSIAFFFFALLRSNIANGSLEFGVTNLFVFILSVSGLMSKRGSVASLRQVIYVYFVIFFAVMPSYELVNDIYYFDQSFQRERLYIEANYLCILGLFVFSISSKINLRLDFIYHFINTLESGSRSSLRSNAVQMILVIVICAVVFSYKQFNVYALIFRGLDDSAVDFEGKNVGQVTFLFMEYFVRPVPAMVLAYYMFHKRKMGAAIKLTDFNLCILVIFVFIFVSPTGIARFLAAALYIPIFMLIFQRWAHSKYFFFMLIMVGNFVAMPFLGRFRRYDPNADNLQLNIKSLENGQFDGFYNFSVLVGSDIVTYGEQLMGPLFFYIPRSYWPEKPVGSGTLLANTLGLPHSNIAMPYIGEGYINFGVLGVAIFMFLLGVVVSMLDRFYWFDRVAGRTSVYSLFYYYFLGYLFFILRGDLLSSTAYMVSGIISLCFVCLFSRWAHTV